MAVDYSFKDLGNKKIEITYNKDVILFQLYIKRSYTVLLKLLEVYPNFYSIHDLDGVLNDPNKAFSELKLTDGFSEYIIEKKGVAGIKLGKINIDKIFTNLKSNTGTFLKLKGTDLRKILTTEVKEDIYKKFDGRCIYNFCF